MNEDIAKLKALANQYQENDNNIYRASQAFGSSDDLKNGPVTLEVTGRGKVFKMTIEKILGDRQDTLKSEIKEASETIGEGE